MQTNCFVCEGPAHLVLHDGEGGCSCVCHDCVAKDQTMTMPHLQNCPHQGDGWCLACVKELHDKSERLRWQPRDFVACSWCNNRGCAACFNRREQRRLELDAEYAAAFPDGPVPIYTTKLDTPEAIAEARAIIGIEAITKAFGPGGGGVAEIEANARQAMAKR